MAGSLTKDLWDMLSKVPLAGEAASWAAPMKNLHFQHLQPIFPAALMELL